MQQELLHRWNPEERIKTEQRPSGGKSADHAVAMHLCWRCSLPHNPHKPEGRATAQSPFGQIMEAAMNSLHKIRDQDFHWVRPWRITNNTKGSLAKGREKNLSKPHCSFLPNKTSITSRFIYMQEPETIILHLDWWFSTTVEPPHMQHLTKKRLQQEDKLLPALDLPAKPKADRSVHSCHSHSLSGSVQNCPSL